MNKLNLKSLIKSIIKESMTEANRGNFNIQSTVAKELDAFKKVVSLIDRKIRDSLIGKPMTGEKVSGGDPYDRNARRKSKSTTIKDVNVEISWKSKKEFGSADKNSDNHLYLYVYAKSDDVDAGEVIFSDYV